MWEDEGSYTQVGLPGNVKGDAITNRYTGPTFTDPGSTIPTYMETAIGRGKLLTNQETGPWRLARSPPPYHVLAVVILKTPRALYILRWWQ